MILFDKSNDKTLIGFQRSDRMYIYLFWSNEDGIYKMNSYCSMIAATDKSINGIGPISLVEWSDS